MFKRARSCWKTAEDGDETTFTLLPCRLLSFVLGEGGCAKTPSFLYLRLHADVELALPTLRFRESM